MSRGRMESAKNANTLVDFTHKTLEAQLDAGGMIVLEHPEDLGKAKNGGIPGSIWRWPGTQRLLEKGAKYGAMAQCTFGAPTPKPTRLLTNVPGIWKHLYLGPPSFTPEGDYLGPLPWNPSRGAPLIGRTEEGFRTKAAAAWPSEMCKMVAEAIIENMECIHDKALATGRDAREPEEVRPSPQIPTRRQVRSGDEGKMATGDTELLYIGRGWSKARWPRSKWANPYKIGIDGNRQGVINLFEAYAKEKWGPKDLRALGGKTLLCHCADGEDCHGGVLIDLYKAAWAPQGPTQDHGPLEDGLPTRVSEMDYTEEENMKEGEQDGEEVAWKGWIGRGPPRMVEFMGKQRAFHDGGGLCSPGRWRPEDRRLPERGQEKLMDYLAAKLEETTKKAMGIDALGFHDEIGDRDDQGKPLPRGWGAGGL